MGKMIKGLAKPEEVAGKEVMMLYGLGFSNPVIASKLNQYMFSVSSKLMQRLLIAAFYKQSMPKWIKKPKEVKDETIDRYCREMGIQRSAVLIEENMRNFLTEIRADPKDFAKYGFDLIRPETNKWF
jgi:hypothetical protein